MRPSELLQSLHEANKRLQWRLDRLNLRSAELTARQYWELRNLTEEMQKDKDDEKMGDWTR